MDKLTVEVGKAEELLEVFQTQREALFKYSFDFLRVHLESVRGHDKAKVLSLGRFELILIDVNLEPSVS